MEAYSNKKDLILIIQNKIVDNILESKKAHKNLLS